MTDHTDQPTPVDTGERDMPAMRAGDERSMLTGMLDWYREGVVLKARGLSPAHAAVRPLTSATSVAGLVKHLALVEDHWFSFDFDGQAEFEPWASVDWDADPDWDFNSAPSDSLDDLLELYQAACDRSRAVTAAHQLDDVGVRTDRGEFTLRWVLVHLLEETARHLGHLDILVEHLEGRTGE
jgi:hypothetical protein